MRANRQEIVESGDLVQIIHNKYTPRALRISIGKIYGCFDPRKPHDHGECMFYNENNIADQSFALVIEYEKCNSSLLTKTNDKSEKPIIDIWFKVIAFDRFDKNLKILWIREKDIILVNKNV